MAVTAAHDLEFPRTGAGHDSLHLATLIACVGNDALDKGKTPSSLPQQRLGPVSILHAGRMDTDGQEQAQRVGQDVALAAQDLLARVIAGRVKRGPPCMGFSVSSVFSSVRTQSAGRDGERPRCSLGGAWPLHLVSGRPSQGA